MATSTPNCGICDLRHQNSSSEVWCSECDEGLCGDCNDHHRLSKATRSHKTVPVDEYMKLPKDILNIKDYCDQHHEKFVTFCQKHNCPCCRVCMIQDHDGCRDKVLLENVVHNVKTSNGLTETEILIGEILGTINEIYQDQQSNVISFTQQKGKIIETICQTRTKINKHLDMIEEALMKELDASEINIITKTKELNKSINWHKEEVMESQTTLTNLKKYASDFQTFCALKEIQDKISKKDQYLHCLVDDGSLKRNLISLKINPMIDDVLFNIQQFGEVTMESRPSQIRIRRSKDKQAQMMVVTMPTKSIDNIRVSLRQKINTMLSEVRGCLLLPNDTMAFSLYGYQMVRIMNEDGSVLSDITTGAYTFDMVYVEDSNSIAVTSGAGKLCITMIVNDSKQIKTTIPVNSYTYGITAINDTLYFCAYNKGLRMVNLRDSTVHDVVKRPMATYAYVAIFNDKLYYTNEVSNTVTCCNLQGHIQWEFKDDEILKYPCGIDVDREGNIYVVGYSTHNVVVISPDGKQYRELLSKTDGLNGPAVLKFDKSKSKLLVANRTSDAVLFDISH